MKTILFFDRCDLTRLYILLTKELEGKANIIHVAFSDRETKELEDAGIVNYVDYQKELSNAVDTLKPNEGLINEIDKFIVEQSKGLFTLNSSIESDRGYTLLSYGEALLLACSHYQVWKNIFAKQHIDVMYHEPASQFMTHIAGLICKSQGGDFLYLAQFIGDEQGYWYLNIDGENYCCKEIEEKYLYYKTHPEEIDVERCKKYLEKYRADYSVAFGGLIKPKSSKADFYLSAIKQSVVQLLKRSKYDRLKNNIDYWMLNTNSYKNKIFNLRQYKKKNIKFEMPVEGEKYFYYSIHLEPEATVLYLSGGFYTNQVKLIENIAASLPAGYYLYVKDHPHEFAYRRAEDYERLQRVPNIRLIDQRIPGKQLIKDSVGVLSIVGTATFEGMMLGKQAYCFGKTYFTPCKHVSYVKNIRDLRKTIYDNMCKQYVDDVELYAYVNSYLESLHKGFVTYFGMDRIKNSRINEETNANILAQSILA